MSAQLYAAVTAFRIALVKSQRSEKIVDAWKAMSKQTSKKGAKK
jgi:hypothetical protein